MLPLIGKGGGNSLKFMMLFLFINNVRWDQCSQNCQIYFSKFLAVSCLGYLFCAQYSCFIYCICWFFKKFLLQPFLLWFCIFDSFQQFINIQYFFNTRSQNHPFFDLLVKNNNWLISGTLVHADNLRILVVEAGGSDVEDHPQLHTNFDWRYMIPCLQIMFVALITLLGFGPLSFFSE